MDGAAKQLSREEAQKTWIRWGQEERCEKCQGQSPRPRDSRHGLSITGEIVRNAISQAPTLYLLAQNPNFYKIPQLIHMPSEISAALSRTAWLAAWNEESLFADPMFTYHNIGKAFEKSASPSAAPSTCGYGKGILVPWHLSKGASDDGIDVLLQAYYEKAEFFEKDNNAGKSRGQQEVWDEWFPHIHKKNAMGMSL